MANRRDLESEVLEYLTHSGGATALEIAQSIGSDVDAVESTLTRLQIKGLVDHDRSGYPVTWGLSDTSQ